MRRHLVGACLTLALVVSIAGCGSPTRSASAPLPACSLLSAEEANAILGTGAPAVPAGRTTCDYGRISGPGLELILRPDASSGTSWRPSSGTGYVVVRGVEAAFRAQVGSGRPVPGGPAVAYTPSTLEFASGAYVVVLAGKYLPDAERQLEHAMALVVARLGPSAP